MFRKGLIGIGPALLFVNFFSLLTSAAIVMSTLGLVSGVVFNKKIREQKFSFFLPRIIVFITLTITVIVATHFIGGPTSNHYLGMLIGTAIFGVIIAILSINSIKEDAKNAWKTIAVLTLLFLVIAEASVYLATR